MVAANGLNDAGRPAISEPCLAGDVRSLRATVDACKNLL